MSMYKTQPHYISGEIGQASHQIQPPGLFNGINRTYAYNQPDSKSGIRPLSFALSNDSTNTIIIALITP